MNNTVLPAIDENGNQFVFVGPNQMMLEGPTMNAHNLIKILDSQAKSPQNNMHSLPAQQESRNAVPSSVHNDNTNSTPLLMNSEQQTHMQQ